MFDGIVLAGGHSLRMGKNKAQIMRKQESMQSFTARRLRQAGAKNVWVNSHQQINSEANLEYFTDEIADCGPLSGIHAALNIPSDRDLLVVPVDLPQLSMRCLEDLINNAKQKNKTVFFKGHPLPVYINKHQVCIESLSSRLKDKKRLSVLSWLEDIQAISIPCKWESDLKNCNHIEDWKGLSLED